MGKVKNDAARELDRCEFKIHPSLWMSLKDVTNFLQLGFLQPKVVLNEVIFIAKISTMAKSNYGENNTLGNDTIKNAGERNQLNSFREMQKIFNVKARTL